MNCIVCRGGELKFQLDKNNHDVYKCKHCDLGFVWPLYTSEESVIYGSEYFSGATEGHGYIDYDSDKAAMKHTFDEYLNIVHKHTDKRDNFLDVGAATGFFLNMAKDAGWKNFGGVEISDYAATIARQKGYNVQTGTLGTVDLDKNSFDAITFWDVIEHVPDPEGEIRLAHQYLNDGGIVALNTPDASSFVAKVFGKRWHAYVPPEHLFYFNPKNLGALLEKSGFEVLGVHKVGKRFTVQYILKTLANWQKKLPWNYIVDLVKDTKLGNVGIPLNIRDNFLIVAKKI